MQDAFSIADQLLLAPYGVDEAVIEKTFPACASMPWTMPTFISSTPAARAGVWKRASSNPAASASIRG
jgi:hypothetical protein